MKQWLRLGLVGCLVLSLSACSFLSNISEDGAGETTAADTTQITAEPVSVAAADFDLSFSEKDEDTAYSADATEIVFSDASVTAGSGAVADGTLVTISAAGEYVVSGSCTDGRIHIAAPDSDDVHLILNGLSLQGANAVITAESADKVIIILADGTANTLADSAAARAC